VIVAIDGPAGSGKSTTARRVAEHLGWLYLDTGAMYRAVGLAFLDRSAPFTDAGAERVLADLDLWLERDGGGLRVLLGGADVSERIRTPFASEAASRASALPAIRDRMMEEQRRIARAQLASGGGVVIEGRDIGTVVFPEADVKVFLIADPEERARRRHAELQANGVDTPLGAVAADLDARDARDRAREVAPLRKASDAEELDTTRLSLEEQVGRVVALVESRRTS